MICDQSQPERTYKMINLFKSKIPTLKVDVRDYDIMSEGKILLCLNQNLGTDFKNILEIPPGVTGCQLLNKVFDSGFDLRKLQLSPENHLSRRYNLKIFKKNCKKEN